MTTQKQLTAEGRRVILRALDAYSERLRTMPIADDSLAWEEYEHVRTLRREYAVAAVVPC